MEGGWGWGQYFYRGETWQTISQLGYQGWHHLTLVRHVDDSKYSWDTAKRMTHFLLGLYKSNLTMCKTSQKSQLKDILQNIWPELFKMETLCTLYHFLCKSKSVQNKKFIFKKISRFLQNPNRQLEGIMLFLKCGQNIKAIRNRHP